jgi:serine/threonine protein kinase
MMHDDGRAALLPGRAAIEAGPREYVHRGSWSKADIYVVPTDRGSVVVKDFAGKPLVVRWLGRFQTARECAAYEALKGIDGIAGFLGRVDAHALLLERLEGTPLRKFRKRAGGRELLAALRRTLDAIHARSVIHNDLRGKDNTLVRADGRIVLIDFAGALRFRNGGLLHRFLFRRLARVDEAAYLKWKKILDPASLTPAEEKFLRRFAMFRRLWLFNPKGALRQS